jgi:mannose-1-phosphate guanylyltransferase
VQPDRLVLEPSGRDTLPALVLAMTAVAAHDPEAVVAVLTADHLIEPLPVFAETLARGFEVAEAHADALVTFGVVPDHAATAFGYLELGPVLDGTARTVSRFAEKPQRARAEAWGRVPKTSVDYGVMEPASLSPDFTVAAVPLAARWLDVGSWPQYGEAVGRDGDGNAVGGATVALLDSRDCVVASGDPDHLVALLGCEGLVVVHTERATLVVPAERAQQVKDLHALVSRDFGDFA